MSSAGSCRWLTRLGLPGLLASCSFSCAVFAATMGEGRLERACLSSPAALDVDDAALLVVVLFMVGAPSLLLPAREGPTPPSFPALRRWDVPPRHRLTPKAAPLGCRQGPQPSSAPPP